MAVNPGLKAAAMEFVRESNAIEGIHRDPTDDEVAATISFIGLSRVAVADLRTLVEVYAPGHALRDKVGLDVRVGSYYPPRGGPEIRIALENLLGRAHSDRGFSPYDAHLEYEHLHPFTDGNGRSGRSLWAWHMQRVGRDPFALSFLHRWYYETLRHSDRKP